MDDLKELFSDSDISKEKCKVLSKCYEKALALESSKVSDFSPCIVKSCEPLARQIFSPVHLDIDGDTITIKSLAFDDVFNKGLSTNRLCIDSVDAIHRHGLNKAKKDRERRPTTKYMGFAEARVESIRNSRLDVSNNQVFAIYDSALEATPSHADVCLIFPENPNKSEKIEIREKILTLFSKLEILP